MRDDDNYVTEHDISDVPQTNDKAFFGLTEPKELEELLQWFESVFPFNAYVGRTEYDEGRDDPYQETGAKVLARPLNNDRIHLVEIADINMEYDAAGDYSDAIPGETAQCIAAVLAAFPGMARELLRLRK